MSGLRILVVGASIAGPSTAYWLAKAGAKVTVIERFPRLRTGGQAVDIRVAGVSVMRQMPGMEAQVRAKTTQEEGISFVREDGRPYGVIRATGNADQQTLISEYEIFRGDLSKILFDMTKDNGNIEYIFNERIATLQQPHTDYDPVRVEFANGQAPSTFDLVVACDGSYSRTRALGFACSPTDYVFPTNIWAAYFSIPNDTLHASKISKGISAPGGKFISIGADPSGVARVMLMSVHPCTIPNAILAFRTAFAQGDTALKNYLASYFENAGWLSSFVTRKMMDSEDLYASEIVQVKPPSLFNGRVVLVGDAGYAAGPTGGGTSLALTGGYMLAGELSKHPNDMAAALAGYEERMRPIVKELQRVPPFVSSILAPQTKWAIWLRNHIFALVAWTGAATYLQRLLGGAFANSKAFPIPAYEWIR